MIILEPAEAEVADVLDKAADHIELVDWIQGSMYDQERADAGIPLTECPVCADGAIHVAVHGKPVHAVDATPREDGLVLHAELAFLERVGSSISLFNDTAGRTMAVVVQELRDTAKALRAGATA